jgi:hypothetical protein
MATSYFTKIAAIDPAAKAYISRIKLLEKHPAQDWQGVWVVTVK